MVKVRELRVLSRDDLHKRLHEFQKELMMLRSKARTGSALDSPGKIVSLRRTIARVLTLLRAKQQGEEVPSKAVGSLKV